MLLLEICVRLIGDQVPVESESALLWVVQASTCKLWWFSGLWMEGGPGPGRGGPRWRGPPEWRGRGRRGRGDGPREDFDAGDMDV